MWPSQVVVVGRWKGITSSVDFRCALNDFMLVMLSWMLNGRYTKCMDVVLGFRNLPKATKSCICPSQLIADFPTFIFVYQIDYGFVILLLIFLVVCLLLAHYYSHLFIYIYIFGIGLFFVLAKPLLTSLPIVI